MGVQMQRKQLVQLTAQAGELGVLLLHFLFSPAFTSDGEHRVVLAPAKEARATPLRHAQGALTRLSVRGDLLFLSFTFAVCDVTRGLNTASRLFCVQFCLCARPEPCGSSVSRLLLMVPQTGSDSRSRPGAGLVAEARPCHS